MRSRIVLDANIYVSALMNEKGPPGLLLHSIVAQEKFQLVMSDAILEELQRVLFYPKVRIRIKRTNEELLAWTDALSIISFFVEPRHKYDTLVPDDPDDDRYVIAALESGSKYIVSGDRHLLALGAFEEIKILSAAELLSTF